jgi:hypothetical protein
MSLDPSWTPATPPTSMYLYWNELILSPQNQFIIADLDAGNLVIKTSELKTLEWELTVDVRLSLCSTRVGWGRRTLTRALSLPFLTLSCSRTTIKTHARSTESTNG